MMRYTSYIWLVVISLAGFGACVAGCTESKSAQTLDSEGSAGNGELVLTEVTEAAGLAAYRHDNGGFGEAWAPEIVGGGGGFFDYDGDGWLDILLVGGGKFRGRENIPVQALWLYRNNGDGTFTERTREAGLKDVTAYGFGISAADYDNDGDQDFFISTLYENLLFRNDAGTFVEVGKTAGVAEHSEWSSSAMFFDADRDGYVDLYVGSYVDWSPEKDIYCEFGGEKVYCTPQEYDGINSRFYHNNGDGTFTERTEEAGFGSIPGKVFGVVELDYNEDGWSDLYVVEDTERDLLYENNRDGTFTERGLLSGIAFDPHGRARAGMGADAAVVDSSGHVTLFVGNFSEETVGVYRHLGNGLFVDRASTSMLAHPSLLTLTFGLFVFDVDLDGDLDLFAANGHVQTHIERIHASVSFRQPAQLYLNRGDGVFDEVTEKHRALRTPMVARGAAYADYDRDGDLDILVVENDGPAHLWRNDLSGASYLRVTLEGRDSNRDGLGARIVALAADRRLERRVRTGSSYLSQSEKAVVFGLDAVDRVDSLLVYWPSGQIDAFADVDANEDVIVLEGSGVLGPAPDGIIRDQTVAKN